MKSDTAKLSIEKIRNNLNKLYEFRNKQYIMDNIMFEIVIELSKYIPGKAKTLELKILYILKSQGMIQYILRTGLCQLILINGKN